MTDAFSRKSDFQQETSAPPPCVMIITGEASGDYHGARVVAALKKRRPDLFCIGIGGGCMARAGVRIRLDAHRLAVVGITEIFAKARILVSGLATARGMVKSLRPDLLILVDFPDFNLMVAKTARKCGVPVLYYISPQIWAWRSGRVKKIRDRVDHMAVILPFEAAFYSDHKVPATFVGHPLLDAAAPPPRPVEPRAGFTLGLLPGSRDREVSQLLPDMLAAARLLSRKHPGIRFVLAMAPSVDPRLVSRIIADYGDKLPLDIETDGVEKVFSQSTLAVAASGTVTLEAAIAGVPTVIVYKVSTLSYWLGRALVRVKHIGLANLIAGREIVPELIQRAVTPENIAGALSRMIGDPVALSACREALLALREKLGGPGASDRVALLAEQMLQTPRQPVDQ